MKLLVSLCAICFLFFSHTLRASDTLYVYGEEIKEYNIPYNTEGDPVNGWIFRPYPESFGTHHEQGTFLEKRNGLNGQLFFFKGVSDTIPGVEGTKIINARFRKQVEYFVQPKEIWIESAIHDSSITPSETWADTWFDISLKCIENNQFLWGRWWLLNRLALNQATTVVLVEEDDIYRRNISRQYNYLEINIQQTNNAPDTVGEWYWFSQIKSYRFEEGGDTTITILEDFIEDPTTVREDFVPHQVELHQNYPNPFNPSTTISFTLPVSQLISLSIYNVLGEEIEELTKKMYPPGTHSISFSGNDIPSGIYIYMLKTEKTTLTRKMMLLK